MKGDFSRSTFQPTKHYRSVLKQQGRVDVDADWNEQQAITLRRIETEASDVIGGCGAPLHDAGFHIVMDVEDLTTEEQDLPGNQLKLLNKLAVGDFMIGAGRFYADGILCENERLIKASQQPDGGLEHLLNKEGLYLIYLDVWTRHITALDDPLIREKALGGPDTATRSKTVWQVKALAVRDPSGSKERAEITAKLTAERAELAKLLTSTQNNENAAIARLRQDIANLEKKLAALPATDLNCKTAFREWSALTADRTGTLNARTQPAEPSESACLLPPSAGYQRLENQLYRIEVHGVADDGTPTFVWSRDNGTVVTTIRTLGGKTVTVDDVGPDDVLGFSNGQWVELTDDTIELTGTAGELVQIDLVDQSTRTITLKSIPQALNLNAHPKLRRWDQTGATAHATGVKMTFDWQLLEDGVQVRFSNGTYKPGDYWLIPARTATGEIEWPPYQVPNTAPLPQHPLGIGHHYCRLALARFDGKTLTILEDCRHLFPPLTDVSLPPKAMHVVSINWTNDDFRDVTLFRKEGLQIVLDTPPDPVSVKSATFIVTLEVPLAAIGGRATGTHFPHLSLILDGTITVTGSTLEWIPTDETFKQLLTILNPDVFSEAVSTIRMRITLKGFALWSLTKVGAPLHLDGQALGVRGPATAAGAPTTRIELALPSGLGHGVSDFESWFFLTLPKAPVAELVSLVVDPAQVLNNQSARGVVTLSQAAPVNGTVVSLAATEPALVQLPASVLVQGGATSASFSIQTKATQIKLTISITAKLDAVTKTVPFVLEGLPA